jgi:glutamate-ammonia-ligase adenylyltransferase
LSPGHYFARLSQRFITAITSQTSEGNLYEVDMRLRPSGNAGPIASSLVSFKQYNEEEAWTWEQMALTRSRIISAPDDLADKINSIIHSTLTRQRDPNALLINVVDMRKRMLRTYKTDFIWDVKHIRGGLIDVEFITQFLQLRHAHQHPDILARDTKSALKTLASKALIDPTIASDLLQALGLWNDLQGMLRLTIPRELRQLRQHDIPESLRNKLVRTGGAEDYDTLLDNMASSTAKVLDHFNTIISSPAENVVTETKTTL